MDDNKTIRYATLNDEGKLLFNFAEHLHMKYQTWRAVAVVAIIGNVVQWLVS